MPDMLRILWFHPLVLILQGIINYKLNCTTILITTWSSITSNGWIARLSTLLLNKFYCFFSINDFISYIINLLCYTCVISILHCRCRLHYASIPLATTLLYLLIFSKSTPLIHFLINLTYYRIQMVSLG